MRHGIQRRGMNHGRSAFTLLELILTLAMSVVLMGLIGSAIGFYGRDMNVRDMDVRQTQLASALMQMIEDDLRATLHGEPAKMDALEDLLKASTGQSAEIEEDLSAAGIESDKDKTVPEESSPANLATSTTVLKTPGLIGNSTSIQVDLSRLPRLEEYHSLTNTVSGDLEDVPSDLKTVAYFAQDAGTIGGVQDPLEDLGLQTHGGSPDSSHAGAGLVRRSIARSATVYASSTGGVTMLNQSGDLLAPEVTAIEFQYWDGSTWLTSWSSDEHRQLPMAVKVRLTMVDATAGGRRDEGRDDGKGFLSRRATADVPPGGRFQEG